MNNILENTEVAKADRFAQEKLEGYTQFKGLPVIEHARKAANMVANADEGNGVEVGLEAYNSTANIIATYMTYVLWHTANRNTVDEKLDEIEAVFGRSVSSKVSRVWVEDSEYVDTEKVAQELGRQRSNLQTIRLAVQYQQLSTVGLGWYHFSLACGYYAKFLRKADPKIKKLFKELIKETRSQRWAS